MTGENQFYDFAAAKEMVRSFFKIRGYQVKTNANIHTTIAREFPIVAKDRNATIGVDLLTRKTARSNKEDLRRLLMIQKMVSEASSSDGSRLEIAVVLTNPIHSVAVRSLCEENGIGLLSVENEKLVEFVKPSQRVTEAKLEAREIQDLISSINTRSQIRFSLKMFTISSKQIEKLDLHCRTENDMTVMMASFNTIIDSLDKDEMKKRGTIVNADGGKTSIDYLQQFLIDNGVICHSSVFNDLRLIKKLRNKRFPVHDLDGYGKICRKLTGTSSPDNSTLATCLISRFLNALGFLRNALLR